MTELLLVGVGGAFGSLVRYRLGRWISEKTTATMPIGTFLVNISGAVMLGLLVGNQPSGNIMLLLADGFLGAYTTFSTFMYEGFDLFRDNGKLNAVIYILCSLILGIAGFMAGLAVMQS